MADLMSISVGKVVFAGMPNSPWIPWLRARGLVAGDLMTMPSAEKILKAARQHRFQHILIEDGALSLTGFELAIAIRYAAPRNIGTQITILSNEILRPFLDLGFGHGTVDVLKMAELEDANPGGQ